MTTNECKVVICKYYCARELKGGDSCKACWLNPALKNNFQFSPTARTLIDWKVQAEGFDFLKNFAQETLKEMDAKFTDGLKTAQNAQEAI